MAVIKKAIADLDARKRRLIRTLEVTGDDEDEPDQELIQDIKNRRAEIRAERARLAAELEALEEQINDQPNPELLHHLPVGICDLNALPDDLARKLFEALRLEIHYNKSNNTAVCCITLTGETLPAVQQTAAGAVIPFKKRATTPSRRPLTGAAQSTAHGRARSEGPSGASTLLFPSVVCPRPDSYSIRTKPDPP